MTQETKQYTAIIGCYGGRRGTTLGELVKQKVYESPLDGVEIKVLGRGHSKFMGNKENTPISDRHINALESIVESPEDSFVQRAVGGLRTTGRKAATVDELTGANAVYVADDFAVGQYAKFAGEEQGQKYQTFLQGAGRAHPLYGIDIDDTECTQDFTNRVVIPKNKGQTPADLKPADSRYFSLDGREYRAGDDAAVKQEAKDLVCVADGLAKRIIQDASRLA